MDTNAADELGTFFAQDVEFVDRPDEGHFGHLPWWSDTAVGVVAHCGFGRVGGAIEKPNGGLAWNPGSAILPHETPGMRVAEMGGAAGLRVDDFDFWVQGGVKTLEGTGNGCQRAGR